MLTLRKLFCLVVIVTFGITTGCAPEKFGFEREFGKSGSGKGELLSASDMNLSSNGNLVIADSGNSRIQIVKSDGSSIMVIGESVQKKYELQSIAGIGIDPLNNSIYVCDQRGNKIVRFTHDGVPDLKISKKVRAPMDVAVDRGGNSYVIMTSQPDIYKYNSVGNFIGKIGGSGKAALLFPTSIVLNEKHIFVTDYRSKKIVKLDMNGQFVDEYRSKGEYEEMIGPSSIDIDEEGNLYILDLGEIPIVVLSPKGELISKIGNFGDENGHFIYPKGIVAKTPKDIYVLDNSRNRVLNFIKKPE